MLFCLVAMGKKSIGILKGIVPLSGSSIQLLMPDIRNCLSIGSVWSDTMEVFSSVRRVSLKASVEGQDSRWKLFSSTLLQQGQRLVFECCLRTKFSPFGRSIAISFVMNLFYLKDLSFLARRILVLKHPWGYPCDFWPILTESFLIQLDDV